MRAFLLYRVLSKSYRNFSNSKSVYMMAKCVASESNWDASKFPVYVLTHIPGLIELVSKLIHPSVTVKSIFFEDFNPKYKMSKSQIDAVKDAEIILCDNTILSHNIDCFPNLKWAHSTWAGVENCIKNIKDNKIVPNFVLTRHSGSEFSALMAEYVLCQIINWERSMKTYWKDQELKVWGHIERFMEPRNVSNLHISILGVGNMGCGVAKILHGFGAKVTGLSRTEKDLSIDNYVSFYKMSTDLATVLSDCDYICNTLPHTEATVNLLGNDVLRCCKKNPVFINVGRGSVIKEKHLIQALKNKWISGAILDVFEIEPLPESSALWNMSQVVITPHVAAPSKAPHIVDIFLKNYELYTHGRELNYQVKWEEDY